jgi:hypothetical protein
MTADLREALTEVLVAATDHDQCLAARMDYIESIARNALAPPTAPAPEPVAWRYKTKGGTLWSISHEFTDMGPDWDVQPLYASPPHQTESETTPQVHQVGSVADKPEAAGGWSCRNEALGRGLCAQWCVDPIKCPATESTVDAELVRMGIDPDEAAAKAARAVGVRCPFCGSKEWPVDYAGQGDHI